MNRQELEHLIRAAGSITSCQNIVVLGSQAILAAFPNAPEELLISMEADVYPLDSPELADLIDGSIGEISPFHNTFGYYAHGVGPGTAILPSGWKERLVRVEGPGTSGVVGWCISPPDLAVSKLIAGRDKDIAFVRSMLLHSLVDASTLRELAGELPEDQAKLLLARLRKAL